MGQERGYFPVLQRAARVVKEGGIPLLTTRAFKKLSSPVFEIGSITFFVRDLAAGLPEARTSLDLALRVASPSELSLLMDDSRYAQEPSVIRDRIQRGCLCFIATTADGSLAHSRWVAMDRASVPEIGMDLVPETGGAYMYDGYTAPHLRRRGVDGAVRCFIFRTLRSRGIRAVYSYVRGDNPVGQRAAHRWQQAVAKLWYLRLRGLRPVVVGKRRLQLAVVLPSPDSEPDEKERSSRATSWHSWFEGWLREPHTKRSTGCSALPEEYFVNTAEFISSILELDPNSDLVLDVGCDSGMVSRMVAPRCREFVAVDFIPGMLADIPQGSVSTASARPASFVAADGRCLPFRSQAFRKIYCAGVIHTQPSHADGWRIVEELIRVCRPGGEVLVASVPDAGKRRHAYQEAWKRAEGYGKIALLASLALPRPAKNLLRRLLAVPSHNGPVILNYDLKNLKRSLEARGYKCRILDFPDDYCSRDFRKTRSNLLISLPSEAIDSHLLGTP